MPFRTYASPSRTAVVVSDAASEPDPGSVSANAPISSPLASPGSQRALLRLGAIDDDALRADAVVGADQRAERGRRARELERDEDFLLHRQAEPAVGFGQRKPEQAELAHLRDDVIGNGIAVGNAMLVRDQALAHEAPDALPQQIQRFAIADHGAGDSMQRIVLIEAFLRRSHDRPF